MLAEEFDAQRAAAIRERLVHRASDDQPAMRLGRWSATALIFSGAVLGSGATAGAIALSAPPDDDSEHTVASIFSELSSEQGFVSGGVGATPDELVFYWNGALEASAVSIVERANAAGLTVDVVQVVHAPSKFWELASTLAAAYADAGIDVWGFGPDRSYSTIEMMGPELSIDPEVQEAARLIASEIVGKDLAVVFVPNEEDFVTFPAPVPTDR